jgi:hypothetical protein
MESTQVDPEENQSPLDFFNPGDDKEKKMPRGRRPKATPPPKKFERQEALKNRIVALSEELAANGFNDLLTPLVPIKPVAPEVVDEKTTARIGHAEESLAVYLQRTSIKDNLSQRPPFDHIADPIYRRLMRDFIQGAQMPEVKIAALRDLSGRIKSLDEGGINYSIIDGLQRSWCYSTTVLLALHRDKLCPHSPGQNYPLRDLLQHRPRRAAALHGDIQHRAAPDEPSGPTRNHAQTVDR